MYYQLLNGCPAVIIPARLGAPLVAWNGMTLEEMWEVEVPEESADESDETGGLGKVENEVKIGSFDGICSVLFEFLDVCVEWDRVVLPKNSEGEVQSSSGATEDEARQADANGQDLKEKRAALRDALKLLVAGAVRSGKSKEVRKEVDKDRAGIAMWRLP